MTPQHGQEALPNNALQPTPPRGAAER